MCRKKLGNLRYQYLKSTVKASNYTLRMQYEFYKYCY